MDIRDSPLHFPDLQPIDHIRKCPRFTSVSNRHVENGLHIDDLDDLQLEIEELLAFATQRLCKVKAEFKAVSDLQDNKKEKKIFKGKDSDLKRPRTVDEKPSKKMKYQAEIIKPLQATVPASSSPSRVKSKNIAPEVMEEPQEKFRGPETPNKFWQMVETYCGDIPASTIKFLEKLSRPVNKNDDIFKIPELGPHFSKQWSLEDLAKDKEHGKCADNTLTELSQGQNEPQQILKKAYESMQNSEPAPYGNLTQRLVSAFVEENIMPPPGTGPSLDGGGFGSTSDTVKTNKGHVIAHTNKLESRIKAELMEQGIIESSSQENDDEILMELKRCQQELYALSERNRAVSGQLLKMAKQEIKKQEIKKKIENVNQEIIEHHRRVILARQKKRVLMRKEKDAILKSIKERENFVKQLEQLQSN